MSKKVLTTQSLKYPSIYLSILNETNLVTHTKRHSLLDKRDFIREYLDSLDIPTEPQQGPEPILNTLPIEETLRHGNTDEAFIQLSQQQEISSSSKRKQQRDDVSSQLTSSNTQNEEDQNLLGEVPRTGNARGITGVIDSKVDKRCKRLSTVDQACENLNMSKRCKECRTKPKRHAEQELNIGSVDKSKDKVRARNRKRRKRQEEPLASLRDMGYPRRQKRAHSPQECIAASKVEYTDGSESDGGHRHCRMPLQRRQRLQTMLATRRMDARSHSNKPRKIFTQSSLIMNQFVSPKVSKERITVWFFYVFH
ncbi:hypothetical protein BCR41DRAFT_61285 [Lobosporangium transversale]|uniref:Uncharacterized protein n=1 Tax=Lobosporangium transversale TaxID=64571 RepID=A0A1Y2GMX1_9FUNG|nr:hypothetical protein BCR41DRAFT_61285 [Lobosporangium transversale]ORZ16141.1 hypothetical protein BCR41DRAFT_61285 [Lobosporangium transversale]|eukprot:XP_021881488.1 hypothetical protein BCR41DRAFT_61285 [Lobosporangium transversale]